MPNSITGLLIIVILSGLGGALIRPIFEVGLAPALKAAQIRFKVVQSYWRFVFFFLLIGTATHFLFWQQTKIHWTTDTYLGLLNYVFTLLFAVFVGYFAFVQVAEIKAEKKFQNAGLMAKSSRPNRAMQDYEKAFELAPDDFWFLAHLLEHYLVMGKFGKFDEKVALGKKRILDTQDECLILGFEAMKHLLQQNQGEATVKMVNCIDFIKQQSSTPKLQDWSFSELMKSESFMKLPKDGDLVMMFRNFSQYLNGHLNDESRLRFERGEFLLKTTA